MSFSGYQLLPHLQALRTQLLEPLQDDHERHRSTYFDLELLPYSLGACWHALTESARIQGELIADFTPEDLAGLAFHVIKPEKRDALSFMVDAFFDAARRAQNAVIHYLSRGLRQSLPSSMNKLVKRLEGGHLQLPEGPKEEILKYWEKHGRPLKAYRDLGQHHALVTSDARVMASKDGLVGLYLLLPSNPEEKAAGRLKFGDPEIHALLYMKTEFKVLVAFLDWLTKGLIDPSRPRSVSLLQVPRDTIRLGRGVEHRALLIPSREQLEEETATLLARLRRGQ